MVVPIPKVQPFAPNVPEREEPVADWREEISRQNQLQVQNMTAEERERERNEIYERFGADIGGILWRAREAWERQAEKVSEEMKRKRPEGTPVTGHGLLQEPDLFTNSRRNLEKGLPEGMILFPMTSEKPTSHPVSPPLASFSPPSLSASATRPSTPGKGVRRIRFAELSPTDVHVYESAPPSPRKKTVLALPLPLPAGTDENIVSFGTYPTTNSDPEEGSPEDIRRKFFPSAPSSNPDLAWMNPSTSDDQSDDSSPVGKPRFDLSGNPIPSSISSTLPTHLGLHHHAEGSHAGYTLDDVFLLTRSSVAAQRAAMLGVLSGVARWLRKCTEGGNDPVLNDLSAKSATLLKCILFAGLEVLPERGSVGARGIAVVWQCLVGWEAQEIDDLQVDLNDVEAAFGEIELNMLVDVSTATTTTPPLSISSLIDALPLSEMLSQLAPLLSSPPDLNSVESFPTPNQLQLLGIVHRIAKHSNTAAEKIVQTSSVVASIINVFLLSAAMPHPPAIHCLITLVHASRRNAKALCDPANAMLKFIASTISSTDGTAQYPAKLALELLVSTLRFYTSLGRYGMYSHTAMDAQTLWTRLTVYVTETGGKLAQTWSELIGTWMICATDPSQVVGWGWGNSISSEAVLPIQNECFGVLGNGLQP
ncbi:RPAP1-like protein [Armillaria nabsnona]|nr:RPAP1-like protein [Armillaria nabsnona]